jgi:hypothetical protein
MLQRRHSIERAWHHEIEQDYIGIFIIGASYTVGAAAGFDYLMTFCGKKCADHAANVRLVIDDEDCCHAISGTSRGTLRLGFCG